MSGHFFAHSSDERLRLVVALAFMWKRGYHFIAPTQNRAKGNQMNEAIAALAATLYGQDAEAILTLDAQERAEAVDTMVRP